MARNETYRAAERKIEEARRRGGEETRSQRDEAHRTAGVVGQFTQLQSLQLDGNQLTVLQGIWER